MTPNYMAILETWCAAYPVVGRGAVVTFHMGPVDRPKRCAWLEIVNDRVEGQLCVWTTGECELEVDTRGGSILLRETAVANTSEEFEGLIQKMASFFD